MFFWKRRKATSKDVTDRLVKILNARYRELRIKGGLPPWLARRKVREEMERAEKLYTDGVMRNPHA